jgi:hydroxyethylthiazole kinase-like uncharacterized protein yjeF
MKEFDPQELKKLYIPPSDSHKGQNGKLMVIGGSKLFHAASLWALKIASRIVDMVFYSSVPENNEIVNKAKEEFRDGIIVPRGKIENYIGEADSILIGPGLPRKEGEEEGDDNTKALTEKLLKKFNTKKWVIDGGSLQTIDPEILSDLKETPLLTPHPKEFVTLFGVDPTADNLQKMAKKYNCVILLKGEKDIVISPQDLVEISGGNPGMTKGGTGDVLAGLVAALYCKNEAFLSACAGSYINKKAGESLEKKVGLYFNSSDLVDEIPKVMKETLT